MEAFDILNKRIPGGIQIQAKRYPPDQIVGQAQDERGRDDHYPGYALRYQCRIRESGD